MSYNLYISTTPNPQESTHEKILKKTLFIHNNLGIDLNTFIFKLFN